WLIFPDWPLHSRSAFSRALLIPASPCSLRCAKLGVARVETASPNASAAAPYLFLRIIIDLLPMRPTSRGNARGRISLAATALHRCKPAGRIAQERLQNRHAPRAIRGMCVRVCWAASADVAIVPSPLVGEGSSPFRRRRKGEGAAFANSFLQQPPHP